MDNAGVDRTILVGKLERLARRPVVGMRLPITAEEWAESLEGIDRALLMRAAIAAVKGLILTDWADRRKSDARPQEALRAVEAWLVDPSPEAVSQVKAAAKACTAARSETFGDDHRIPEAARSIAWAVGARDSTPVFDALVSIENELLARIALTSEYDRAPEQRRALVGAIQAVLAPPEAAPPPPAPMPGSDRAPVPYAVNGRFEVGQRLIHKKFGEIVVTALGESTLEVELSDGSKKRLANQP